MRFGNKGYLNRFMLVVDHEDRRWCVLPFEADSVHEMPKRLWELGELIVFDSFEDADLFGQKELKTYDRMKIKRSPLVE